MAVEGGGSVPTAGEAARRTRRPRVSVIIPVHNGQRFLADAIGSVLDQTYREAECLVVDDGSTDRSAAIAASFGPAVRVLSKPNGGVASARNAGVAATSGELVAFLDADDVWLPDKLERQVRCWERRPGAGMVFCGFAVARDDVERPRYCVLATNPEDRIRRAALLEGYGIAFGITALLSRRALELLGPFDDRLSVSADVAYAWRLLQRFEVLAVPEPLAVYRLHDRSQMHHDLAALEHDRRIVTEECLGDGTADRIRATANLHTHLAYRWLQRRDLRRVAGHGRIVLAYEPSRLVALPADAVRRRVTRRLLGRWPARAEPGQAAAWGRRRPASTAATHMPTPRPAAPPAVTSSHRGTPPSWTSTTTARIRPSRRSVAK